MKNLFVILVVMVFSASFIFAQNTSTVDETGDNHSATVTQTGSNNNSDLDQIGLLTDVGTVAIITQTGTYNKSIVWANDNTIKPLAHEHGNVSAFITQTGYRNISNVKINSQTGTAVTVRQIGDRNEADVDALHSQNEGRAWEFTRIYQTGDRNYARSYTYGGNSRQSEIYQDGNDNTGLQDLAGIYDRALIDQDGNSNQSYQYVNNAAHQTTVVYTLLDAYARQFGSGNYAYQLVGKEDNARIRTYGNSNKAYQYQYGTGGSLISKQNNWADIYQYNGNGNFARQDQIANDNTAITTQNGSNNWNYDWQNGSFNTATTTQTGNGHHNHNFQDGDSNTANVVQSP